MIKALSYCSQCKKSIDNAKEILFVDETYHRGYCSEKCIEDHFGPIISGHNQQEQEMRLKYNCEIENCLKLLNEPLPDKTLLAPSELYSFENEGYETLYSFIYEEPETIFGKVYYLGLGLIMEGQFSFLFMVSCTQNKSMVKEFRVGKKVEKISNLLRDDSGLGELSELNDEDMSLIELKKSTLLAQMLEERMPSDIPIENFMDYEDYLAPTIEEPDEIFQMKDEDGDEVQTYIKSFVKEGMTFFYFAVCLLKERNEEEYMIIPYMSFPTIDADLYKKYCQGDKITGSLKN